MVVNKFDIIIIRWLDAVTNPTWREVDTIPAPYFPVNTVGFFIGESEDYWVVACNHAWMHGDVDTTSIPKKMITDVEVIRRAKV